MPLKHMTAALVQGMGAPVMMYMHISELWKMRYLHRHSNNFDLLHISCER